MQIFDYIATCSLHVVASISACQACLQGVVSILGCLSEPESTALRCSLCCAYKLVLPPQRWCAIVRAADAMRQQRQGRQAGSEQPKWQNWQMRHSKLGRRRVTLAGLLTV